MMSALLTIVAYSHANPNQIDLVKPELEKLIPINRRIAGTLT
jgi:hypothetical protein